jgi:hypothetical protein
MDDGPDRDAHPVTVEETREMFTFHQHRQHQRQPGQLNQGGQSLVEFAFTMPLLIALLVGIIVLAWVGFTYVSITSAARMGARHMVTYPIEAENPSRFPNVDDEITYVVTSTMPYLDWPAAEITILPQPPESRLVGAPDPLYVSVQIVYPVNNPTLSIPQLGGDGAMVLLPPLSLQATARMRLD